MVYPMVMFCGVALHMVDFLPRVRNRKVGGIRFIRIGQFQASFCRTKR